MEVVLVPLVAGVLVAGLSATIRRGQQPSRRAWRSYSWLGTQSLRNSRVLWDACVSSHWGWMPSPKTLSKPTFGGYLYLSHEIDFRGPRTRPLTFQLQRQQVRHVDIHGDHLYIHIHGEPHPVDIRARRTGGLAEAVARFLHQPPAQPPPR